MPRKGIAARSKGRKHTKSNRFPPWSSETKDTDCIRIGRFIEHDDDGTEPASEEVLLAEMYRDRAGRERVSADKKRLWFWSVTTWKFNGKRIGNVQDAWAVNESDIHWLDENKVVLDDWLQDYEDRSSIFEAIVRMFRAGTPGQPEDTDNLNALDATLPVELPCEPIKQEMMPFPRNMPAGYQVKMDIRTAPETIRVIAVFVDGTENKTIEGWKNVYRCTDPDFRGDERLQSAKRYFRRHGQGARLPRVTETGLEALIKLRENNKDLDIWVLPQWKDNLNLYKWQETPHDQAFRFLDPDRHEADGDWRLYVEVHVVDRE